MGWGRALLLGDVGNRLDIADCENEIRTLKQKLRDTVRTQYSGDDVLKDLQAARRLNDLQRETDELKLYLSALIRSLVAHGTVSQEEILKYVEIIDAEDGTVDGKMAGDIA